MKNLCWLTLGFVILTSSSCDKAPEYLYYTEQDLQNQLTPEISNQEVIRLFGEPVTYMELDETGYMLRFQMSGDGAGDLRGFDAFFTNDRMDRWEPWKRGDPNLPGQR